MTVRNIIMDINGYFGHTLRIGMEPNPSQVPRAAVRDFTNITTFISRFTRNLLNFLSLVIFNETNRRERRTEGKVKSYGL